MRGRIGERRRQTHANGVGDNADYRGGGPDIHHSSCHRPRFIVDGTLAAQPTGT